MASSPTPIHERVRQLEIQLQECLTWKEALETSICGGPNSRGTNTYLVESEAKVARLGKRLENMDSELRKYKRAAHEVQILRDKVRNHAQILEDKTNEYQYLSELYGKQTAELTATKEKVADAQRNEQDMRLIAEMFERDSGASRDVKELQKSEKLAWAKVQRLVETLEESNLDTRVQVAIETEIECRRKLMNAENDIADLRDEISASKRVELELREALNKKIEETNSYLKKIEVITEAYNTCKEKNQELHPHLSRKDEQLQKLLAEVVRTRAEIARLEDRNKMLARLVVSKSGDLSRERIDAGNKPTAQHEDPVASETAPGPVVGGSGEKKRSSSLHGGQDEGGGHLSLLAHAITQFESPRNRPPAR